MRYRTILRLLLNDRAIAALRALAGDRRAMAAVEFGLAAPAIFMFIFGIIEVGYTLWLQNALNSAVAAAARCASITTNVANCSGSITSYISNWSGADFDSGSLSVVYTAGYTSAAPYSSNTDPTGGNCGCLVTATYPLSLGI